MKCLSRSSQEDGVPQPDTTIGVGSTFRGTLMVAGTLRIEGELEGDILNCERLEIGEHGLMRADIEVKEADPGACAWQRASARDDRDEGRRPGGGRRVRGQRDRGAGGLLQRAMYD